MKNFLLIFSFTLVLFGQVTSAQVECEDGLSVELGADGEAFLPISDLVPNIEFLLTQGAVSYFVFPQTTGGITSSDDLIALSCENRGVPYFVIELVSGGDLIDNCGGQLDVTSPNGGCGGSGSGVCEGPFANCLSAIAGFSYGQGASDEIFATDIALCEDELACDGVYQVAYGTVSNAANLTFTASVNTEDAEDYKNPVVLSYTIGGSVSYTQTYVYVWDNAECILLASYNSTFTLESSAELTITPESLWSDVDCGELYAVALTEIGGDEPSTYTSSITVTCDDIGVHTVWVQNLETGFVVSRDIQILDPLEACGSVLGPDDKLISYTEGVFNTIFSTDVLLNGTALPKHPGGLGWIINQNDLIPGENILDFVTEKLSLNGISTLDLVLGQRIILIDEYEEPWEAVVFDVDEGGYTGIGDMIAIRELILGISNGEGMPNAFWFSNNHVFPSDFDPFNFENTFTSYAFDAADFDSDAFSFTVRKAGDVNGNAIPGIQDEEIDTEFRSVAPSYMVSDVLVDAGDEFTFTLRYDSEEKIKGLLAALVGDGLEFLELSSTIGGINYNIPQPSEIRVVYVEPTAVAQYATIDFEITARASKSGQLIELLGLKSGFPQEVVTGDNTVVVIDGLDLLNILSVSDADANLISIYPNPAHQTITIDGLDSEIESIVIFDHMGKVVLRQAGNINDHAFNVSALPAGMYVVMLTTSNHVYNTALIKQ